MIISLTIMLTLYVCIQHIYGSFKYIKYRYKALCVIVIELGRHTDSTYYFVKFAIRVNWISSSKFTCARRGIVVSI